MSNINGVCGADPVGYPDEGVDMLALQEVRNDYRWTPLCQRRFLEELAFTGSIARAAQHVEKSLRGAYALRYRREGAAFALGWDAAILMAWVSIEGMLHDRAICGYEEVSSKDEDGTMRRGKFDNRLSYNLLNRLDRLAAAQALAGSRDAQVQLIRQDFESFLDLIEAGGNGSEAALFVAARTDDIETLAAMLKPQIDYELAQISADEDEEEDEEDEDDDDLEAPEHLMEEEPEDAAARMSVWWDEIRECYMTNFPSAHLVAGETDADTESADGENPDTITELGNFGHRDYRRKLTPAETAAHQASIMHSLAPWIAAAEKAREVWFGSREGGV